VWVAGFFDPPRAAVVEMAATSAATTASAIQRETFTCPPSPKSVSGAILTRGRRNRKTDPLGTGEPRLELPARRQARDDSRVLDHVRAGRTAPAHGVEIREPFRDRHRERGGE